MENNGVWIRIQFNTYNLYEGSDDLVKELKEICPVQSSTKWYPAACTGYELLLSIDFNLSLSAFINNVLIPGAEFAGVCYAAKSIWKIFDKFITKNDTIEIQELNLNFDDVTIEIESVMSYTALQKVYNDISDHLQYLESKNIKDIYKIKLPFIKDIDDKDKPYYRKWSLEDGDDEELFWEIIYERGLERCFYNPNLKEIIF